MTNFDHREATTHYEQLLAPIYGWMLGDVRAARDAARAELARLGVGASSTSLRALDLGAGLGIHAVALAELGYAVTAIDTSHELLAELERARPDVTRIVGDLAAASELTSGPFQLIVCMGDTLTHLASSGAVRATLESARRLLAPDGKLLLSWRDYTQARQGTSRFIPVRSDAERILTCCLDYEASRVLVTDLLYENSAQGWQLRASAYHKLRLSLADVEAELAAAGFAAERGEPGGGWLKLIASPG